MGTIVGLIVLGLAVVLVTLIAASISRPPAGVQERDPHGVRSIAMFTCTDETGLFDEDDRDDLLVGVRFFKHLHEGLREAGLHLGELDRMQNAHMAIVRQGDEAFALVVEWLDPQWALSVEWTPKTALQRRHQKSTYAVYAPQDVPELRTVLQTIDEYLHRNATITDIAWHRREDWAEERWNHGIDSPFEEE